MRKGLLRTLVLVGLSCSTACCQGCLERPRMKVQIVHASAIIP